MFHIVTTISMLSSHVTVINERTNPISPSPLPPPPHLPLNLQPQQPTINHNDNANKPTDPDYLPGKLENFTLPSAYQLSDEDLEEIQEIATILELVKMDESILTPARRSK